MIIQYKVSSMDNVSMMMSTYKPSIQLKRLTWTPYGQGNVLLLWVIGLMLWVMQMVNL